MANEDPQNLTPPDETPVNTEVNFTDPSQEFPEEQNGTTTLPENEVPEDEQAPLEDTPDNPPVTWTAQEYIHEERTPIWFILFVIVVIVLVGVSLWLQAWSFSALIVVMAVALLIYIRRPPRELTYALSPAQGLYVGERLYHFDEFKAFGLIKDGEHHSIMLIPRQRFAPGVSVFFPEEAGERIVDILGQRLPMEELKLDVVDTIVRKLRL